MTAIRKEALKTQNLRLRFCSNKKCQTTIKTVETFLMATISKPLPKEFADLVADEPTEQLKLELPKKELIKPKIKANIK